MFIQNNDVQREKQLYLKRTAGLSGRAYMTQRRYSDTLLFVTKF